MELYRKISDKPSIIWINGEVVAERIDAGYYHVNHIQLNKSKIPMFKISTYCSLSKKRFNPNKYNKEYFKYIDISNVDNNTGVFKYQLVNIKEAPSRARKKVSKNDIIISTVRPNRNAVAIINIEDDELVVSTGFAVIECKKNIDSYYLFAVLKTSNSIGQLVRKTSGGLYPAVSEQDVMGIEIPIPSSEIQKYIGDKVRKAEELREEAKRLKKEAEEIINDSLNFRQLDLLYKGSKVKFKWISTNVLTDRIDGNYYEQKYVETINHIKRNSKKYITLNSIIDSIYTGKKPMYDEKGTEAYFVQSGNISSNFLEIDNKEKVDLSKYNQVLFGDLLIAKDGETIGKIAINLTNEIIIINEHTYCVRLKEKYKYYSAYIYYLLINDYINPLIRREATGSAQKGLNFSFAENIIIPILEEDIIINLYNLELRRCNNIYKSKQLVQEAKQDVEDLIEGNFDMSKVKANN